MSTARQLRHQPNDDGDLDGQLAERAESSPSESAAGASPARRQSKSGRSRSERIATPSGFVYRVHPNREGQDSQVDGSGPDIAGQQARQPLPGAAGQTDLVRLVERQQQIIMELSDRLSACQVELAQANERLRVQQEPVGPSVSVLLDQSDRLQQLETELDRVRATIANLQAPPAPVPTFWQSARRWLGRVAI
jgi:hypothetical protein